MHWSRGLVVMTDVLIAMFAFLIIATCAQGDAIRGLGCVLTIVFVVIAVTIWIVGTLIGLGT